MKAEIRNMDLGTLNSRRREAVTSTEGRIRVVAGAGTGNILNVNYNSDGGLGGLRCF